MTKDNIQKMTVIEINHFTNDIIKLILKSSKYFNYCAGQYVMMGLEKEDLRPFSMASAPREDGLIEFHIRLLEDNEWMINLFNVKKNDFVYIEGPKDQYKVDKNNSLNIILIAGGTGFAPMKAILERLLALNKTFTIDFYWGARQSSDLYSHQEMLETCQKHNQVNYIPVISEHEFKGRKGLVHKAVLSDHPNLSNYRVYLCGSWPMQEAAKTDFLKAGLKENLFN